MDESQIIAALFAFAKAHPYIAAAAGLWLMLSLGWKAQPKEKRDELAKAYPRLIGVLRFFLELLPDLLGAARVLFFAVIRGQASRGTPAVIDDPLAGTGEGIQLSVGIPPRETQPDATQPQRPSVMPPSEPGYAEQWVLGVIALAAVVALALSGCAAAQSPSLSPISPNLVERPEYGTCAETGGKLEVPQAGTVALLTSVCWMRADAGVAQPDAAPEPVVIVPEKGDAGASE